MKQNIGFGTTGNGRASVQAISNLTRIAGGLSGVTIGISWIALGLLPLGVMFAAELSLRTTPQGELFGTEDFAVRVDRETGWPRDVLCDEQIIVQSSTSKQWLDLRTCLAL